jgi:hypothetical protein
MISKHFTTKSNRNKARGATKKKVNFKDSKAKRILLQEGVRIYPNVLEHRTVPQQTAYRSKKTSPFERI